MRDRAGARNPARCCTYLPTIANYLVGRALAEGGRGAALMRARLDDPRGREAQYLRLGPRTAASTEAHCPLWDPTAPPGRGCSIYKHRPPICRTWHCLYVGGGVDGAVPWTMERHRLTAIERRLIAAAAVAAGTPPSPSAPGEDWAAWYRACAAATATEC